MKSKSDGGSELNSGETSLSDYERRGKVFIPPLAKLSKMPQINSSSWGSERLPEMLWAALLRQHCGQQLFLLIGKDILDWIANQPNKNKMGGITHTDIANLNKDLRREMIKTIVRELGTDVLKPLLLLPGLPAAEDWKREMGDLSVDIVAGWNRIAVAIQLSSGSPADIDLRAFKLMALVLCGKMKLLPETLKLINELPGGKNQLKAEACIRSSEAVTASREQQYEWVAKFWHYSQRETQCISGESVENIKITKRDAIQDKKYYEGRLIKAKQTLIDHFFQTLPGELIDARHEAVFGIALYSTGIFVGNALLLASCTINNRVSVRILFESYITLKYLLHKEKIGDPVWRSHRDYGVGQIISIQKKYREKKYNSHLVEPTILNIIANEDKWSEFTEINVGHWDNSNLRKISIQVREKSFYDKYYGYTSGYIHTSWGAVREFALQSCLNPLHRGHRIPRKSPHLAPNANEDCRLI